MKNSILLIILFFSCRLAAQTAGEEISFEIENYDMSELWLSTGPIIYMVYTVPKLEPVGYFGRNYQRFYIHLISAIQSQENKSEYLIYGKNQLENNISEIQGTFVIEETKLVYSYNIPGTEEGYIKGSNTLFEDKNKSGTGIFKGSFETQIELSDDNRVLYGTPIFLGDGFRNNQFEGTWTSYKTGNSRTCNWGDYRIPNSDELDDGVGQMFIKEEFVKNRWANFATAYFPVAITKEEKAKRNAAIAKEKEEWWK